jgi:hypothetical protein
MTTQNKYFCVYFNKQIFILRLFSQKTNEKKLGILSNRNILRVFYFFEGSNQRFFYLFYRLNLIFFEYFRQKAK